ncbi:MAG: non-ribosomal peptide synthetase, partial [Psychrosphaera sp.]|nr:non-ribosomal peptide synthetase [Psychrosphaera sp.]
ANDIDTFFTTTALFNHLIEDDILKGTAVRNLLFGGELADQISINKCLNDYPQINLVHVYGPTETVVYASAYHFNDLVNQTTTQLAPIGSPLNNKRFYVLDDTMQAVPIGEEGELYIGGAGLARGYLNREGLTAQCFVDNPFASKSDLQKGYTRLYKTGDLVRWLPDGNLQYVGRNDFQVKIRGHRIELGEIEHCLHAMGEVKQAVVIDRQKDGSKYLAAYLVMATDSVNPINQAQLHENCCAVLPDYMIPSTFTAIDTIPLTINGKLDKTALPEPQFSCLNGYVAPTNAIEQMLCEIWQAVLGLEFIGIEDNFFRLGGDSIKAIKLTGACRKRLKMDIPLSLVLEYPTVAGLA